MGSDAFEVVEAPLFPYNIKVHRSMCTEFMNLVDRVSRILREAEAAQPGGSGIRALVLLSEGIEKAKLLLRRCSEYSKLYLALTGEATVTRCQKAKVLLEQSLSQLQTMVPVMLAAEISRTISDLRGVVLRLEPAEQDAVNILRKLFQLYKSPGDSSDETAFKSFQVALLRLQITSQKDILIEKRSIQNQLNGESDPMKKKILSFFLCLLKKYGNLAVKEQTEIGPTLHEEPVRFSSSSGLSVEKNSHLTGRTNENQVKMWHVPVIPEEFKCPLSSRLMCDPVVIDSGVTFERLSIQKWFDEGHNTCPKTKKKLDCFSLTQNVTMKNIIAEWCTKTGVSLADPIVTAVCPPLESSASSIGSLTSLVRDLALPDMSYLSVSSSQGSDSCETRVDGMNLSSVGGVDSHRVQYGRNTHGINMGILVELDSLSWESKCMVIRKAVNFLKYENKSSSLMSSETLIQPLLKFLKDAYNLNDVEALRTGCLLLSVFFEKCSAIPFLEEETYQLLASFLDTEVAEETLAILEVLSSRHPCDKEIAAAGALHHFVRILDKENSVLKELALKILCNLSGKSEIKSLIAASDFIQALIPRLNAQFGNRALESYCALILKNLCDYEDARAYIAESDGCIASIIGLLESESQEDQENAVAVLISLCSQRLQYCKLVMEEDVFASLMSVSNSGNDKGKASAMELLRILGDAVRVTSDCSESEVVVVRDPSPPSKERKSSRKLPAVFAMFSKRNTKK